MGRGGDQCVCNMDLAYIVLDIISGVLICIVSMHVDPEGCTISICGGPRPHILDSRRLMICRALHAVARDQWLFRAGGISMFAFGLLFFVAGLLIVVTTITVLQPVAQHFHALQRSARYTRLTPHTVASCSADP